MRTHRKFSNRVKGVLLIGLIFGVILGHSLGIFSNIYSSVQAQQKITIRPNFNSYTQPEDINLKRIWEVWNLLQGNYIAPPNTEENELTIDSRVDQILKGLSTFEEDPYTSYLTPEENTRFNTDTVNGEFEGIGARIGIYEETLTVIEPLKGSPAQESGLQKFDKIIKVDGRSTEDLTLKQSVDLIRGKRGTNVELTVDREDGVMKKIIITRDKVEVPSIEFKEIGDVFFIKISSFSRKVPKLFRAALQEFAESGKKNLILDLRGNPGGLLDVAVNIGGYFIEEGEPILYDYSGGDELEAYISRGYARFSDRIKIAVLVDGNSASASEIVAAALQHYGIATVIGDFTVGKASIQRVFTLQKGAALKVTIARWLTPAKESIPTTGIIPDILVTPTEEQLIEQGKIENLDNVEKDIILKRALTYFKEGA